MTSAPTGADALVGVLALQGDVREHEHALAACGVATRRVRTVEDLDGIDALVVPGGESTTMSNLALRWGLMEPLRDLVRGGLPAYGSCAGMIMLADRIEGGRPDQETIGGLDVTVRRNAFGRQVDSFEADLDDPGARRRADARGVHPRPVGRAGRRRGPGARRGRRAARPPVGSSRSGRVTCSRPPSTPS